MMEYLAFAVGARAVEFALEIRDPGHGNFIDRREQVAFSYAGQLAGAVGDDPAGHQAAACLDPPHAIVGLLEPALLPEIQHGKEHQANRGQGQQCRLQSVEKARFHTEGVVLHGIECTWLAMRTATIIHLHRPGKHQKARKIQTFFSLHR